jgi:hypothetical protein
LVGVDKNNHAVNFIEGLRSLRRRTHPIVIATDEQGA